MHYCISNGPRIVNTVCLDKSALDKMSDKRLWEWVKRVALLKILVFHKDHCEKLGINFKTIYRL